MKNKNIKEKITSIFSSLSGAVSFLGSYQVCHALCLWIITLLSLIGITVVGMPLLFFQKVALPFWVIALALLIISFLVYYKKKCISRNLLIFNLGILIAGIPFKQIQDFSIYFISIGGLIVLMSLILMIKNRSKK